MEQGIEKLNFWMKKVTYLTMRTVQDFLSPSKSRIAFAVANSECYGTCGDDSGCSSNSCNRLSTFDNSSFLS